MIRVHVICEGQTEETFVNELLAPVFQQKGISLLPSLIGKPGHKGGNFKIERLQTDVRIRLLSDQSCYCTTFFDYHGLPSAFPGKSKANQQTQIADKSQTVQQAMLQALEDTVGDNAIRRFIPYVHMYEFEALLFSNPTAFANGVGRTELGLQLSKIAHAFTTPEHINDSPQTAPSKRIESLIPGYEKPLMGNLAALEVGLEAMRKQCGLFNAWLDEIERLTMH